MLAEIKKFVKEKFNDITIFIVVALLIMLSFASGYIMAKQELKQPIEIENNINAQ